MEAITFFAGMQAFGVFLQVWQKERDYKLAAKAYFEEKEVASTDPVLKAKSKKFNNLVQSKPRFSRLFSNKIGQCEDVFEDALRNIDAQDYNRQSKAVEDFSMCKCQFLSMVMQAQGGTLLDDLQDMWDELDCSTRVAIYAGKHASP
jgi:hypothetical protein